MAYIITFSLTLALTYIYDHSGHNKAENNVHVLLGFIIIMLPSILGGLRSIYVGSDNINYNTLLQYTASHSFLESFFAESGVASEMDKGFLILTWLISRLSDDYRVFAFITSFITFAFVFEGAKYYRNRFSMTVIIACYLLIYYCPMFNYVRQAIALAIVFYALKYAEQRSLKKFAIAIIIATTIHVSAIISLAIYLVFYLNEINKIRKWYLLIIAVITILIMAGPSLIATLLYWIGNLGIRPTAVFKYARRFASYQQYHFVPVHMLRALPQLLISTLCYKRLTKIDDKIRGYYILCWIQAFLMVIGCVFEPFTRNSLYFNYSEFILAAALMKSYSKSRVKYVAYFALIAFLLIYWYFFTVMNYYGFQYPVFPYLFA